MYVLCVFYVYDVECIVSFIDALCRFNVCSIDGICDSLTIQCSKTYLVSPVDQSLKLHISN